MNAHWTDEELIGRLYGAGPEDAARTSHLAECGECSARWKLLAERRGQFLESARLTVVDEARLRAQREAVWRRVEDLNRPRLWRMAPAGATAMLVLFGLLLHTPSPQVEPTQVASVQISDEQLFSEIATMVNEEAPRAAQPIQGLFDEGASVEVQ